MNIKSIFALLAGSLIVAGCSTMEITSKSTRDYPFSQIQTYQWLEAPEDLAADVDPESHAYIHQAINNELMKRGIHQVDAPAKADVQVACTVKLREKKVYLARDNPRNGDFSGDFAGGFSYQRDSDGWKYDERDPDLQFYGIEIGTVSVVLLDVDTGKRVWRGTLQTKTDRSQPKEQRQKSIRAAIEKLMKRLPESP